MQLRKPFIDSMGSDIKFTNNHLPKMPIFQIVRKELITLMDFSGNKIT